MTGTVGAQRPLATRLWLGSGREPSPSVERGGHEGTTLVPTLGIGLASSLSLPIYAAGVLWPFAVQVPASVANQAVWTSTGTLRFEKPGLGSVTGITQWQATSLRSGLFSTSRCALAHSVRS